MQEIETKTKFCKYCGQQVAEDAIMCTCCGRQIETLKAEQPNIVINNTNTNTNVNKNINAGCGKPKNKWVALVLCIFTICGHKFYEGNIGSGLLYLFTCGLFGVGWIIDIISLIGKPNPYYV